MKIRVLFICCDNAARSQMAEHILNHLGNGEFEARSAGSNPKPVHPTTIEVLKELNIDASGAHSHSISEFSDEHFDYIINVCERSLATCQLHCSDNCPTFPGHNDRICWGFEDINRSTDDIGERVAKFKRIRNEITNRLRIWIPVIEKSFKREPSRLSAS